MPSSSHLEPIAPRSKLRRISTLEDLLRVREPTSSGMAAAPRSKLRRISTLEDLLGTAASALGIVATAPATAALEAVPPAGSSSPGGAAPEAGGIAQPAGAPPLDEAHLDRTVRVWQTRYRRPLTRDDACEMVTNVFGFLRVLCDWKAAAQPAAVGA